MLASGYGGHSDLDEALSLYAKACRDGDRKACDERAGLVGSQYGHGLMPRDLSPPEPGGLFDPVRFL